MLQTPVGAVRDASVPVPPLCDKFQDQRDDEHDPGDAQHGYGERHVGGATHGDALRSGSRSRKPLRVTPCSWAVSRIVWGISSSVNGC